MKIANFLAITAVLLVVACSSPQQKAEKAAARAQALYDVRDFEGARLAILQSVQSRDDRPEYWQLLGRLDLETGRPADALLAYSRVLELDATNMEAMQLVAELSFQFGNIREATKQADRVLALDPNATRAILVKGLAALTRRNKDEAMQAADEILRITPGDEFGLVLKARTLASGGDVEAARTTLEEGVPEARRTEASLATLAELYRVLGESDKLIATLDRQIARRPKVPDLQLDLAEVLYKAGNAARARTILYPLLRAHPDDLELNQKIAQIWTDNDAHALSPSQLMEVVRSGSHIGRVAVSRYLIARDRPDLAEPILRVDADSQGDVGAADAKALYATALYRQGKLGEARAIVDGILREDTNNIDALLVRARISMQQGYLAPALNDAQIVVREFPMSEQGRMLLSDVFEARKDPQRARLNYEDAIDDIPQGLEVNRSYINFLLRTGDTGRAEDVARTFVRKSPSLPKGWDLLANVCKRAGNAACVAEAAQGRAKAASVFTEDDRPGSLRTRGLFGRL